MSGIAQRERLGHADQRLVERRVAVRVVAAHHVADDLGALAVLGVGGEVLLPHREQDAALHRLEPVAHVGQGARGDDRQRVVEIPALRRVVQGHRAAAVARHPVARAAAGRRGGGGAAGVESSASRRRGRVRVCAWPLRGVDQSSRRRPWRRSGGSRRRAEMRGTSWSMQDWAMSVSPMRARRPSASTRRATGRRAPSTQARPRAAGSMLEKAQPLPRRRRAVDSTSVTHQRRQHALFAAPSAAFTCVRIGARAAVQVPR